MKLSLKKSQLKNLSKDNAILPNDATAQIAGAGACTPCCPPQASDTCPPEPTVRGCRPDYSARKNPNGGWDGCYGAP
ncbi:hypothetical protein [Shewanella sp. 10N.286.54.B9]|uniref:hypothetical protein n=1 Tax=Shewanella sp. 10N.286.54.B9 TaxID=3229719 RepID=UPI00354F0A03